MPYVSTVGSMSLWVRQAEEQFLTCCSSAACSGVTLHLLCSACTRAGWGKLPRMKLQSENWAKQGRGVFLLAGF